MFFWLVHFVHLQYRFNRISYTPNTVYTHPRSMFHFNVHRTISFHIRFTIFHQLFIQKWARAEKKESYLNLFARFLLFCFSFCLRSDFFVSVHSQRCAARIVLTHKVNFYCSSLRTLCFSLSRLSNVHVSIQRLVCVLVSLFLNVVCLRMSFFTKRMHVCRVEMYYSGAFFKSLLLTVLTFAHFLFFLNYCSKTFKCN